MSDAAMMSVPVRAVTRYPQRSEQAPATNPNKYVVEVPIVPINAIVDGFEPGNLKEYSRAKIPKINSVGTKTKLCIRRDPNTTSQPFRPPSFQAEDSVTGDVVGATVIGISKGGGTG